MAKVSIAFVRVSEAARALTQATMPVTDWPLLSEELTSSASSQATTITAPDGNGFWRIEVSGGRIYAAGGLTPDAEEDPRIGIGDGQVEFIAAGDAGHKVAVVDAA